MSTYLLRSYLKIMLLAKNNRLTIRVKLFLSFVAFPVTTIGTGRKKAKVFGSQCVVRKP